MLSAPLQTVDYLPNTERAPARRLWPRLSMDSRRLIAFGAVLLLTMVAAVALAMWNMHHAALDDVRQNVAKLGIAISEQTARSFQAVDVVLEDFRRDIAARGIDTPERFTSQLGTPGLQKALRRRADTLPQAEAFSIIDANGKLVNFSRQWPIPPTDLSDRDYYAYLRDHDDPAPFISAPVQNRGNGGWTVYVVRRVNGPSGQFLGMVLGAIDLNYFRDFYQALTAGAGTTVLLLNRDGTAMVSYPTTAAIGERLPAISPWYDVVRSGHPGSYMVDGLMAPGPRVVSAHPLSEYPLVVNVSVSERDSLAHWRGVALLAILATSSAVLCVILLLRALSQQLQRLESSEATLAGQNARLETTRRRMEVQAGELQASREHLAQKSAALGSTLDHMNQGIMMVDGDQRVAVCNARAVQMLDLPPDVMSGAYPFEDVVAHQHAIGEFSGGNNPAWLCTAGLLDTPLVYERTRPNGTVLEIQSVILASGGMVRTYSDITERRRSEERVRYFAHHDDLTKLVNRVVFQERLHQAIDLANRSGRSTAVLYLDLDRFKLVNDTKGHAVGDKLLAELAERLRSAVRDIDTVARMGGDEFAIIQPLIEHQDASSLFAERLLHLIKEPFDIDGVPCSVGLSIGIAHYPDHAATADGLLRNADTALYRAKAEGRGVACVFEEQMDTRQQQLFALEQELAQALDLRQFELEYQPIVDARTHRITGCEALLRWRHPVRGLIGPGDFIGLVEMSRMIVPIGLWAMEQACAEAVTWPGAVRVAVNLSPLQFKHEGLIDAVLAILARTGLPARRLILEVTEGVLLEDSRAVLDTIARLRAHGIALSLDDFGTAHAGLSYLRRFPFDAIKIDKSFVQEVVHQRASRAIIAAMLGIGTSLGLRVVAEGVETEAQLDALKRMDCHQVQGFLTGRPKPAAETRAILWQNHAVPLEADAEPA